LTDIKVCISYTIVVVKLLLVPGIKSCAIRHDHKYQIKKLVRDFIMLKKIIKLFLTVTVLVTVNNTNLLIAMEAAPAHSVQSQEIRECGACFEPLKQDDIEFPCLHGMCNKKGCYSQWVNSCFERKLDVTCPMCRFVLIEGVSQQRANPITELSSQDRRELNEILEQLAQEFYRQLRRRPILRSALEEHAITVHKKATITQISTFALPTISILIGSYIAKKWVTTSLGLVTTTFATVVAGTAGVYLPSLFYLSWHKRAANSLANNHPELRACADDLSMACEESKKALFAPYNTTNGSTSLLNAAITLINKCGVINRHVNKSSEIIADTLRRLS
jgi:hypothetical protein